MFAVNDQPIALRRWPISERTSFELEDVRNSSVSKWTIGPRYRQTHEPVEPLTAGELKRALHSVVAAEAVKIFVVCQNLTRGTHSCDW